MISEDREALIIFLGLEGFGVISAMTMIDKKK